MSKIGIFLDINIFVMYYCVKDKNYEKQQINAKFQNENERGFYEKSSVLPFYNAYVHFVVFV